MTTEANLQVGGTGFSSGGINLAGTGFNTYPTYKIYLGETQAKVMYYVDGSGVSRPIKQIYYGTTLVYKVA